MEAIDPPMSHLTESYKNALAHWLHASPNAIELTWKGRVSLYSLLQAMGITKGDEVIIQAYTCVVVPNAVLYCGAIPVYVDIDPATFCASAEAIQSKITNRTKAIICQNTYGLSAEVDKISELAKRHKIWSIEDCTHGFGGTFKGRQNGTYCDAAFFSSQWNKPFSTGVGGFSLVNNSELRARVSLEVEHYQKPTIFDSLNLLSLYFAHKFLLHQWTYWQLRNLYRFLSSRNLVIGSSDGDELASISKPLDFEKAHAPAQAWKGLRALGKLSQDQARRKSNARVLTDFLTKRGLNHVPLEHFADHCFCKYPVLVSDRSLFSQHAHAARIQLGDWFTSPLHPIQGDLSRWNYNEADFPNASFAAQHAVNLPIHDDSLEKILEFLERTSALILKSEPDVSSQV